jgi:hypothetical protein
LEKDLRSPSFPLREGWGFSFSPLSRRGEKMEKGKGKIGGKIQGLERVLVNGGRGVEERQAGQEKLKSTGCSVCHLGAEKARGRRWRGGLA